MKLIEIPFLCLFFFITSSTSIAQQSFSITNKFSEGTAVNKELLLQLINGVRKKGCKCGNAFYNVVPSITWNDQLEKAAVVHSKDMSAKNYFSHISADGSGAGDRIHTAGYQWMQYGENIGMGYSDERHMVEGWLKSTTHCKNIMNKAYNEMGVAHTGNYWVQEFGSK